MNKGIIMEINNRSLTVMTPNGEFIKVRKSQQTYLVGEEIDFPSPSPIYAKENTFLSIFSKRTIGVFALAAALIFFTVLPLGRGSGVYAYVSIDINPSIEIALSEDMKVVGLTSFNKDGKEIIEQLSNWKNKKLETVTEQIIEKIAAKGYLKTNHEIIIGTVIVDEDNKKIEEEITTTIDEIKTEIIQENTDIEIKTFDINVEDREKAVKQGKSAGKLLFETVQPTEEDVIKDEDEQNQADHSADIVVPADRKDWNNGNPNKEKKNENQGNENKEKDPPSNKNIDKNNPSEERKNQNNGNNQNKNSNHANDENQSDKKNHHDNGNHDNKGSNGKGNNQNNGNNGNSGNGNNSNKGNHGQKPN